MAFGLSSNKTLIFSRFVFLAAVLIFIGYTLSQSVGFGLGGFDVREVFDQFNFYVVGLGYLMGLFFFFLFELSINEDDDELGDSVCFVSQGLSPSLELFNVSTLKIIVGSAILSILAGILNFSVFKQSFIGTKILLEQQFTPTGSLIFSSLLIPISENLGAAFVIAFVIVLIRALSRKFDLNRTSFSSAVWIVASLATGFYGIVNHLLRYSGSETALFTVFMYWFVTGLITVMVGSFIPGWFLHIANNFFADPLIASKFSSDGVIAITVLILVFLVIVLTALILGGKKR